MLKQLRMVVLLCALLALPLSAAAQDYKYFSMDVPQDWTMADKPKEDSHGNFILVLARNDIATVVMFIVGPSGNKDVNSITKKVAKAMGATSEIKEDRGQYRFDYMHKGKKGVACVAADPKAKLYMVTSVIGDMQAAKPVLESVRSDKYPLLVAK